MPSAARLAPATRKPSAASVLGQERARGVVVLDDEDGTRL
jgi:hypothetical protein